MLNRIVQRFLSCDNHIQIKLDYNGIKISRTSPFNDFDIKLDPEETLAILEMLKEIEDDIPR